MQRQRGGLVPIGDALSGMPGPVQALRRDRAPQRGFTLADQVDQSSPRPYPARDCPSQKSEIR